MSLPAPLPLSFILRPASALALAVLLACGADTALESAGKPPLFMAAAHADDGDGGDDGGGDGGDDGGGSAGGGAAGGGGGSGSGGSGGAAGAGSGPGGGGDIDFEPPEDTPAVNAELFIVDELLAVNPSAAALRRANALGITVLARVRAASLPLNVVRLRLPRGLDAKTARQLLARSDPGVFDLHHLYALAQNSAASACSGPGCSPLQLIGWPDDARNCGRGQTIGIVDTAVATAHPALAGATVRTHSIVDKDRTAAPSDHGTAVAALLVGRAESGFPGMLPRARLLAAAPFYTLESGTVTAHTAGLVGSLDWLVAQGAKVVGMSLAGPHNLVLDAAIARAAKKGVVVVAAAGNGGRRAPPAYPAAFDQVLAVTAISPERRVYWRANQGDYVDYALPGVDLWTADSASADSAAGKRRSGTSFAVPFMVGMASQGLAQRTVNRRQLQEGKLASLSDLGSPGRDPVFGWGKPRFIAACR